MVATDIHRIPGYIRAEALEMDPTEPNSPLEDRISLRSDLKQRRSFRPGTREKGDVSWERLPGNSLKGKPPTIIWVAISCTQKKWLGTFLEVVFPLFGGFLQENQEHHHHFWGSLNKDAPTKTFWHPHPVEWGERFAIFPFMEWNWGTARHFPLALNSLPEFLDCELFGAGG